MEEDPGGDKGPPWPPCMSYLQATYSSENGDDRDSVTLQNAFPHGLMWQALNCKKLLLFCVYYITVAPVNDGKGEVVSRIGIGAGEWSKTVSVSH